METITKKASELSLKSSSASVAPEELTLSSGIPVILQHYDGAVAATYWWNKVGSADERPEEAGFAHFLEHMLFKDSAAKETGMASTGQTARAIESLGGDINAYTSFDQTVYHVTCAATHWEKILDVFGGMAKPQRFLKKDFDSEREVILEELRKNEDSPGRQLFQSLFSASFKKHPYGKPVIGYTKTLKAANVGKLEAFYKRNYVSGNMGLLLVGPINEPTGQRRKKLLALLEKHFGKKLYVKKSAPLRSRSAELELHKKPEFSVRAFDVKSPSLAISFRVPNLQHPDIPALDLLTGVLGMGEMSRLFQSLFYKKSLATEISGSIYIPSDPGMLSIHGEAASLDQIKPLFEGVIEEIQKLCKELVTDAEIARVMTNIESERLYATQTADSMAGRLGFLKFSLGDLNYDRSYMEQLKSVDAEQIRLAAQKYFQFHRMSVVLMVPKSVKYSEITALETHARNALAPLTAPKSTKTFAPAKITSRTVAERIQSKGGVQILYRSNPASHVSCIYTGVMGGLRLELPHWGASNLLAMTWTKGSKNHSSNDISALIEGSAASMDGFSGRNTIGLQLTGLTRDWHQLSNLMSEVLVQPTFPEDELQHSKRVTEESIRSIEDHSSQLCSQLFMEALFEKHPYGKRVIGSLESIQKIDSSLIKKIHAGWVRPENLTISISGSARRAQVEAFADHLDSLFKTLPPAATKLGAALADEAPLKAPRWVEKNLGREQIHIIVGGLGLKMDSEEKNALKLMQNILGGQSGRLFIELREKKSLAYTVSPMSLEGIERGYVGTYIACSPGKKDEAIQGIKKVLEDFAKKGPTASEMNRCREYYLGRRAMDLQSDGSMAGYLGLEALYGLPILTEEEIARKIRAVTAKQIQEVCRKYLVEPHMVTAIVG